jgi:ABC-type transport system involved in multi-copper enzyme maturation permease subunit
MTAQLRSELLKLRSTGTVLGLVAAMFALVLLVVLLHGFGVAEDSVGSASVQLTMVFGRGEYLGALFAALLGALSITSEFRHGTIRPTMLANPARRQVIAAKVGASMLVGGWLGLAACGLAVGAGTAALAIRGIEIQPDAGDYALLVAGGAAAAALWAAIGVGLGALVRDQVPTLIGICAWMLFVEGLLVGDVAGVADIGRFAPGAAGAALSGQDPDTLLAPGIALVLLALYAGTATLAGSFATDRRDVG